MKYKNFIKYLLTLIIFPIFSNFFRPDLSKLRIFINMIFLIFDFYFIFQFSILPNFSNFVDFVHLFCSILSNFQNVSLIFRLQQESNCVRCRTHFILLGGQKRRIEPSRRHNFGTRGGLHRHHPHN